jgi:hypothetical protein
MIFINACTHTRSSALSIGKGRRLDFADNHRSLCVRRAALGRLPIAIRVKDREEDAHQVDQLLNRDGRLVTLSVRAPIRSIPTSRASPSNVVDVLDGDPLAEQRQVVPVGPVQAVQSRWDRDGQRVHPRHIGRHLDESRVERGDEGRGESLSRVLVRAIDRSQRHVAVDVRQVWSLRYRLDMARRL